MPIYRFSHECGFGYDQFLKVNKSSVQLECPRCGRQGTARRVNDKTAIIREKDGTTGVLRRNP